MRQSSFRAGGQLIRGMAMLALAGLFLSPPVLAVDFFWTGGGEDDLWSNPENWGRETGFPSGAADDVFFGPDIAAGEHTVVVDGDYEVRIIRFYQDEADPKPAKPSISCRRKRAP